MTPAEARVARAIGKGQTIETMATSFNVSRETIRSQVKSTLGKAGLKRQADLVSMLAGVSLRDGGE